MKIQIKRVDISLPLPEYKTSGAAGFDLLAREKVEIPAQKFEYVPLNVIVQTPPGYFFLLASRSSTHKKGLMMANGIGIGDSDFCGPNDEYRAVFFNFTSESVVVERGERIAQGLVLGFERVEWEEVEEMQLPTRGGFGSTGV